MLAFLLAAALLGHPRLACYGSIGWGAHSYGVNVGGAPFLDSTGAIRMDEVRAYARFDVLVLDASPLLERPDIADSIRAQGTGTRIVGLVGAQVWLNPIHALLWPDTSRMFERELFRAVTANPDWRVRGRHGFFNPFATDSTKSWEFSWTMTNFADAATTDSFVAVVTRRVRPPLFDGCFIDLMHARLGWMQSRDSLNLAAMGVATVAAYDSASMANHTRALAAIRAAEPPDFMLAVNGPFEPDRPYATTMRENFPHQSGGTWESNMTGWNGTGYLTDPPGSFLNVLLEGTCQDLRYQDRIARFALGSAALGEGYAVFTCKNDRPASDDRSKYWYDEMAVDLKSHRSSQSAAARHWLGQALGPARQWQGVWRRDFDQGTVVVNPGGQPARIAFEATKYRILGASDVNRGGSVVSTTIPGEDALFVLRRAPGK